MNSKTIYNYVPCSIIFDGSKVSLPKNVEIEVKKNWNNLMDLGKKFANNELFTIDSMKKNRSTLIVNAKKTLYDHYLYSANLNFVGEHICRSLASNALILTSDNYYVLAVMSSKTSLPGKIKFIGGSLSEEDLVGDKLNPFKCIKREIFEEIGLREDRFVNISPKYFITRPNLSFLNTLFVIEIDISYRELQTLFFDYKKKSSIAEFELDNIIGVQNNSCDIKTFLDKNKPYYIDYMEECFRVLLGEIEAKNIFEDVID